ncbi:MAG TPA: folate-binding protein [Burkholderiaceae bacterium]|jgi:folate-binding protein YgfZ|nr:folate-binding protein [Burkholderiaceae bacterium]
MHETVTASFDGAVRLADWGVIRAAGPDAASFLHAQLTQDIIGLEVGRARLAGYCSAKGRLLASFVVWRSAADELLLACSADLLAPTLKRLSMFVLRAKCKLTDASAELPLFGVAGATARAAGEPWQCVSSDRGTLIRLPDARGVAGGVPRALAIGDPALPALDAAAWAWLEVGSGVPRIVAATVEQFVPQMVNLELVGGVNFQKGCYPGQEIVARSQYRGTLKRRAFLFSSEAAAQPGQEIFHEDDREQPAGMVANSASFEGRHRVLAELKLAALGSGRLHLGAPDGPLLQREDLPYPVPLEAAA